MSASVLPHTSVPVAIVAGTSTMREKESRYAALMHFDYEGKGKSVCCPYCGTRLQIKDTLKRTLKEAYYFSSLEVVEGLQVQRVFRLETTFRKGMPMEVDYWEACRLWLNAEGKLAVTA